MAMKIILDLDAARKEVFEYKTTWMAEKILLDKLIADCKAAKTQPGNDYWKHERAARLKYDLAQSVLDGLLEAANG